MKTRFTWLGIVAACILSISTFFVACNKDGLTDVVVYHGQVVYLNTTTPFAGLTVKVTDGRNTHCQTQTDAGGLFSLKVRVNEIDGNYYLLAGDSTCVPKKVALGGYGQAEVDLGTIEVEGPALPVVVTNPVQTISAQSATLGGEVMSDGRLSVTARGICYGTNPYPTIDGLRTNDGVGKGPFSSVLKDLEFNTIYYARAYATNLMGTAYGEQVKFTTEEGVAIVVTDSVYRVAAHSAKCKGHVESDGGFPVTKRGTCWSKRPDPTVDDECTDDGSGKGEFTSTIKDLLENTTYYIRTYATNSTKTTYGEQIIITTLDGLAEVRIDSISAITATSFSVHSTVVSDCDIPLTARGVCYSKKQYPTIDDAYITSGKGLGSFRGTINSLEYATTYYVRAYATNETGTVYSEQIEVATLTGLPTVTTADITNIGSVKATCGGNVTDDGTLTVTARGVCYGTEPQPSIEDTHTTDGKGTGEFITNLKNLQDKTTYYVRAYATTDAGTAYGEQKSFKTENGIPVVQLSQVGEPTANSVTCVGNVTGDGGVNVTERGLCYSTSQYPTKQDSHVELGTGTGEFTGSLTGLNINTTYYVRAYAVNSIGVGYSDQQSFTTKDGLAIISTAQATSTATSITTGGDITDDGGYAISERGVCYSLSNAEPSITDEKVISGKGKGSFSVSITGLTAGTTYYIRAYATNANGTAYGQAISILTKNGNATVLLGDASNITALTASASVTVTDAGSATLQSCGICWSINPNPTITDNKTVAGGKALNTAYICNMTNLSANTTYYIRGYATTNVTTAYSDQKSFRTQEGLPVVTTGQTTATATKITSGGTISSDGGYSITARGVCYSTNNSVPTIADNYTTSGIGTGAFTTVITSVDVSTTYYVRAYATNSIGTAYGEIVIVTTGNGLPSVTTTVIGENVTQNTAISGGQVTNDGGYPVTARGVCWNTLPYPTINNSKTTDGSGTGYYTSTVTGIDLTSSNVYYVRAYATNQNGTTYGEQVMVSKENLDYKNLPSVEYGGYIYRIYPDIGAMTWTEANTACENLVYGGYDDWMLPETRDLLIHIMTNCKTGWKTDAGNNYTSTNSYSADYWTSQLSSTFYYYECHYYYGEPKGNSLPISSSCRVRPIRKYLANQ